MVTRVPSAMATFKPITMSSIFPYRVEYWPAPRHAIQPPTVERSIDCGQCPRVIPSALKLRSSSGPNVPALTSATHDVVSMSTTPSTPVMSSATPPNTGTLEPHTPDRPPAAETGTRASLQHASTEATCCVVVGRATAPGRWGTAPLVAQRMAIGHQSRPASARTPSSVETSAQQSRSRASSASSTETHGPASRSVTDAGSASTGVTGVGTVTWRPVRRWPRVVPRREGRHVRGHRGRRLRTCAPPSACQRRPCRIRERACRRRGPQLPHSPPLF